MSRTLPGRQRRISSLFVWMVSTLLVVVPGVVAYTACNPESCQTGCCGDTCLSEDQGCCDGNVYDLNSQGCCEGTVYDLATEGCCSGMVFDGATESCCGGTTIYDISTEYCCEECGCVQPL